VVKIKPWSVDEADAGARGGGEVGAGRGEKKKPRTDGRKRRLLCNKQKLKRKYITNKGLQSP
jgi:hypothetical protein